MWLLVGSPVENGWKAKALLARIQGFFSGDSNEFPRTP
ncbi:conserved hypothetical protein [delta proteobacterium NaphS2]|nr:conserved hypothetical protein [delta proteobacterium NaphS2]